MLSRVSADTFPGMREAETLPWPLISLSLAPRIAGEGARLLAALRALAAEDERLHVSGEPPAEIQLGGLSEDHLDATIAALRRDHGIDVMCGAPTVAFRETIASPSEVEYRQRVGQGFVSLTLRVKPMADLSVTISCGEGVPGDDGAAALREGIEQVLDKGLGWGFPVVGVAISVPAAEGFVEPATLRQVAAIAARQMIEQGCTILLEPIMDVTVTVPDGCADVLLADLGTRRADVLARRHDGEPAIFEALVPLINLFGYSNSLRALSGGRGSFTLRYACYRPAPRHLGRDPPPAMAAALRA